MRVGISAIGLAFLLLQAPLASGEVVQDWTVASEDESPDIDPKNVDTERSAIDQDQKEELALEKALDGKSNIEKLFHQLPGGGIAESAYKLFPKNQRKGIEEYLNIVGVVADPGENVGIASYTNHL